MKAKSVVNREGIADFLSGDDALYALFGDEAEKMLQDARSLAPVDTGRLRDSYSVTVAKSKRGPRIRLRNVAPYAAAQEFGSSRRDGSGSTPAHPSAVPALYATAKRITNG